MSSSFAILFRGEAYRWGCDPSGIELQRAALLSHVQHIVMPLEEKGHRVRAFFAFDHRVCKGGYLLRMSGQTRESVARSQHAAR